MPQGKRIKSPNPADKVESLILLFLANKNVLNIGSASRRLNKERSCKFVQKNLSCAHECSMRRWTVKSSEIEKIS